MRLIKALALFVLLAAAPGLLATGCDDLSVTPDSAATRWSALAAGPGMASQGMLVGPAVEGVTWVSPTAAGVTDVNGTFDYLYGEHVLFTVGSVVLGTAAAGPEVTAMDLVPLGCCDHPEVLARACLLQCLDADADPTNGVTITPEIEAVLDASLATLGMSAVDFSDLAQVDALLDEVVAQAEAAGLGLARVDQATARANLVAGSDAFDVLRVNASATPALASAKGKLNLVGARTAGFTADGEPLGRQVLPLTVIYNDELEGTGGARDVFAAVSLDDGHSWRRWNLSRSATRSSFDLPDGTPYPGGTTKASAQVKGRYVFVTWTSKYCPDDNPTGLPEEEVDRYGINGAQGFIDYDELGYPGHGVIPYGCVWEARGMVKPNGSVQWLRPEQLTSGNRDALQNFTAGNGQVGFALTWQEDPAGLQPGDGEGPGHGWSGANVSKGTDIWYSFVRKAEFFLTDPDYAPADDPDDVWGWQRAAVPLSRPVPVTDNAPCKYSQVVVDDSGDEGPDHDAGNGSGADDPGNDASGHDDDCHGRDIVSYPYCLDLCVGQDESGFCTDVDGRPLDGNSGASRAVPFLIPETLADGTIVGSAVIAYEETKGLGHYDPYESGKSVQFHYFSRFDAPDVVAPGDTLNLRNSLGEYENARRPRLIVQPPTKAGASGTTMIALYKQGTEGKGRPSDIMLRRAVGGYSFAHFAPGQLNISSATPLQAEDGCWTAYARSVENLADESFDNPLDDARAHRGALRGDKLVVGYTWTPLWGNAKVGLDKYDLFVTRSFDGGVTWTNAAGEYEPPRNLTQLPDATYTTIEPRIVGTPSTIKNPDGTPTGFWEDMQVTDVFYVAYGTSWNGYDTATDPADLYFARTGDFGETYECVPFVDPDTGEEACGFRPMALGDVAQAECQIRMTPSGSRFFTAWAEETETLSDILFRAVSY